MAAPDHRLVARGALRGPGLLGVALGVHDVDLVDSQPVLGGHLGHGLLGGATANAPDSGDALQLAGAFVDAGDARVAQVALDGIVAHVAVAAVHLQAP